MSSIKFFGKLTLTWRPGCRQFLRVLSGGVLLREWGSSTVPRETLDGGAFTREGIAELQSSGSPSRYRDLCPRVWTSTRHELPLGRSITWGKDVSIDREQFPGKAGRGRLAGLTPGSCSALVLKAVMHQTPPQERAELSVENLHWGHFHGGHVHSDVKLFTDQGV